MKAWHALVESWPLRVYAEAPGAREARAVRHKTWCAAGMSGLVIR